MSYLNLTAFSDFTSSVLKLSKQSRYTWCTFLSQERMEPWRLRQLGLHMFTEGLSTCELFQCISSFHFISAEAFKAIKVRMNARTKTWLMTLGAIGAATWSRMGFLNNIGYFILGFTKTNTSELVVGMSERTFYLYNSVCLCAHIMVIHT